MGAGEAGGSGALRNAESERAIHLAHRIMGSSCVKCYGLNYLALSDPPVFLFPSRRVTGRLLFIWEKISQ